MAVERFVQIEEIGTGLYDFQIYDAENNTISEVTTLFLETFNDSASPLWDTSVCTLAVRSGGAGVAFSTPVKPRVFFQTDVNGLLQVDITDVAASLITGFLTVRIFSQYVTNRAYRHFGVSGG